MGVGALGGKCEVLAEVLLTVLTPQVGLKADEPQMKRSASLRGIITR